MVLLNASSRSRNVGQLVNRDQGGGEKKAGLPYIVGRTASSSLFLAKDSGGCELPKMQLPLKLLVDQSRPINVMAKTSSRFKLF